jgi:hypothetical protein
LGVTFLLLDPPAVSRFPGQRSEIEKPDREKTFGKSIPGTLLSTTSFSFLAGYYSIILKNKK